ncbi:DUF6173 family protein [Paenibacillus xylanexedens]|uniref:DUF6173 family protein n=1 Tax=Paenibacillus xylanexedens TaxID=528191 RepID=UPI0011A1B6C6|nr:DUF6173 family protein [Paenibacillus xylanexedens]
MFNREDFMSIRKPDLEESFELPIASLKDPKMADTQYEILMEEIREFERALSPNEEIAILLASFGQSVMMNVTEIGFHNPSLMVFYGYVNGQRSQLIQHISQLNFLLTSVPNSDPDRPARRIGFVQETE